MRYPSKWSLGLPRVLSPSWEVPGFSPAHAGTAGPPGRAKLPAIPGWTQLLPLRPGCSPPRRLASRPSCPSCVWEAFAGHEARSAVREGSEGRLPEARGLLLTPKAHPVSPDSPGAETPDWWSQPHVRPPAPLPPSSWVWPRGRRDRRKPSPLRVSGNFRTGLTSSSFRCCRRRCERWGGSRPLETRRERPPNQKNKSLICLSHCG